jgi:hypothetical protein
MKRICTIGVCVATACAIFALTASSALATENLPHYGKCVAKAGGPYKNSGCTKLGKTTEEMKFEWQPLTTTVAFKSNKEKETGEAVLESAGGTKIHCSSQTEKFGEYGPGDQVKNVIGEFAGCATGTFKCESEGQEEGLINTEKLDGEPGIVTKETKEEKNIDGSDLRGEAAPNGSANLAKFSCAGAPVLVRGGVVVKAQADSTGGTSGELTNKMANKIEVEFVAESGGKQVPENWTPNFNGPSNTGTRKEINEHLESSLGGAAFEGSGQTLTTVQESIGKVKLELRQCEKTISCPN